jgi:hypothetical protein
MLYYPAGIGATATAAAQIWAAPVWAAPSHGDAGRLYRRSPAESPLPAGA